MRKKQTKDWCPLTGGIEGRTEGETNIITRVRQTWKGRWGINPVQTEQVQAIYEAYTAWRQDPNPHAKMRAIPLGRPLNGSEIRVNMGNRIVKGADTKDSTTVAIIRDAPADSSPSDIVRLITGLERLVETAVASGFEDALRRAEGDTGAEEALARGLLLIAIYEAREGDNYPRALRLLDIAEGKLGRDALRGKKVIEAAREAGKTTAALLKEATRIKKAIWQERAEAIWRGNPNHSKLNVARIIEKETGESYHTIRQGIVKPK